jgi:hypothetical protein
MTIVKTDGQRGGMLGGDATASQLSICVSCVGKTNDWFAVASTRATRALQGFGMRKSYSADLLAKVTIQV